MVSAGFDDIAKCVVIVKTGILLTEPIIAIRLGLVSFSVFLFFI